MSHSITWISAGADILFDGLKRVPKEQLRLAQTDPECPHCFHPWTKRDSTLLPTYLRCGNCAEEFLLFVVFGPELNFLTVAYLPPERRPLNVAATG